MDSTVQNRGTVKNITLVHILTINEVDLTSIEILAGVREWIYCAN